MTVETLQATEVTAVDMANAQEVGVYAPAPKIVGRPWQKGQSGNPLGGALSNRAYKKALLERFSPVELADYWLEALRIARRKEDAGAMGRILKDISEQVMGKPVATQVTVKTKYEELLMLRLAAGEGETIDGEKAVIDENDHLHK